MMVVFELILHMKQLIVLLKLYLNIRFLMN